MRSVLFAAFVCLPSIAFAQLPPSTGCGQRIVTHFSGVGELAFSTNVNEDGVRELWLHYTGPLEGDVGRVWPMSAKVASKQLAIVIGKHSVPSDQQPGLLADTDPGRATLPAGGVNHGAVKLPPLRPGKYELAIRKGQMLARYALEVRERGELRVRALQSVTGLLIAAEVWREVPEEQKLIVARCTGDAEACKTAYDSQLIADARLEDGGWLNTPIAPDGCVLREPEGGFPALPPESMLTFFPVTR
ncbi:MAG: hypothetical protein JNM17_21945 [Archangium sp.]|nr:hypothetical protein [Archangium sp.]